MTTTINLERDVELNGVTKTFRAHGTVVPAVRGIDVSIAGGETVALLGPNGAGKSTTIDMLLGLISTGSWHRLAIRTTPGASRRPRADRRDVAGRSADPRCDAARAAANDGIPAPQRRSNVEDTLELAGIADIADRRTHKLSGGQAQRVRFALALVLTRRC